MQSTDKIDLADVQLFCKTATCKSFTEASILLGTTPSSVSKAIARLEKKLSLKLFIRSTRAMQLTEEGMSYYEVCSEALGNIHDIENQLTKSAKPRGTLRISMPDSYGESVLIPYLKPFFENYKEQLQIEVALSNSYVNFTKESIDIAIRIGDLQDARIIAKYLHDTHFKLVASPEYIAEFGMPKTIEELHQHQCIGLKFPDRGNIIPWEFGDRQDVFTPNFALLHSHSMAALDHAVAGLGIARLLDFSVQREIQNGSVIEVLPGTHPPPMTVHLVYPSSRYVPAKTRLFIDFFFNQILPKVQGKV